MPTLMLAAVDLVAICLLTFAIYLPRHHRAEMVPAFIGVNIGVLAVSLALTSATVSMGLGLGLFGVLSIIRLRSSELSQREIAYYFAGLALGLLGGVGTAEPWLAGGLMALVVLGLFVADHPRVSGRGTGRQQQVVVLDRALPDGVALRAELEHLLGARVVRLEVQRLDLVNDSTTVLVDHLPVGRDRAGRLVGEAVPA